MVVLVLAIFVIILTVMCSVSDFRTLKIPNYYVAAIAASFVLAFALSPDSFGRWWDHAGAMGIFLVVTYLMFCMNLLGAGDAKYGSALALWVGLKGLLPMLLFMSIAGGLVGIVALIFKRWKPVKDPKAGGFIAEVQSGRNAVPYGIAISFGFWVAFYQTEIFTSVVR
jgi:prepilin peptidase CpaA